MGNVILGIVDPIGRLKVKSLLYNFIGENTYFESNFCNYLYNTDYGMNPTDNSALFNWESGFGDITVSADLSKARKIGSNNKFVFGNVNRDGQPLEICPRNIFNEAINTLYKRGVELFVGVELEFYVFKNNIEKEDDIHEAQLVNYDTDYDFLQTISVEKYWEPISKLLVEAEIELEGMKCECGQGQIEINLKYGDAVTIAENVILSKHLIKNYFASQGLFCTFMAKPNSNDAGSGLHIHCSLKLHGRDLSIDDSYFQRFVQNVTNGINDWLCFYAPNLNSYKRHIPNMWAPIDLSSSLDKRTSAVRVIKSKDNGRFELRVPGADANIFLAITAIIYSGIFDDQKKTKKSLCSTFEKSIFNFKNSEYIKEILGDVVHSHYYNIFLQEYSSNKLVITDYEYKRYFANA